MVPDIDQEEIGLFHHIPEIGIDHGELQIAAEDVRRGEIPAAARFGLVLDTRRPQEDVQTGRIGPGRCRRYGLRDEQRIQIHGGKGRIQGRGRLERRPAVAHHRLEHEVRAAALQEFAPDRCQEFRVRHQFHGGQVKHLRRTDSALGSDGSAAAGHLLPAVANPAGHEAGIPETARRHRPGHISDITGDRGLIAFLGRRNDDREFVNQGRIDPGLGDHRVCESHLPLVQMNAAHLVQGTAHEVRHRIVGKTFVIAGHQLVIHRRTRAHRGAFGRFQRPGQDVLDGFAGRTAEEVLHTGLIRNHIRGLAAVGNHIMDPRGLGHVLPHHVHHVIEHLHGVQGGSARLGGAGSMGRLAGEGELHLDIGQAGGPVHGVPRIRMPVQHRVQPFENTFPHHVGLSAAAFLRRASEQFHRPGETRRSQPLGHRNGTGHRAGSQQIVPAGVPRGARNQHFLIRHRILRHAGDGVIFRHHADYRRTASVGSDKSRRNPRYALLHGESLRCEERSPLPDAALLLVTGFSKVEDLLLQRVIQVEMRIQIAEAHRLVLLGPGGGDGRGDGKPRQDGQQEDRVFHKANWFLNRSKRASASELNLTTAAGSNP